MGHVETGPLSEILYRRKYEGYLGKAMSMHDDVRYLEQTIKHTRLANGVEYGVVINKRDGNLHRMVGSWPGKDACESAALVWCLRMVLNTAAYQEDKEQFFKDWRTFEVACVIGVLGAYPDLDFGCCMTQSEINGEYLKWKQEQFPSELGYEMRELVVAVLAREDWKWSLYPEWGGNPPTWVVWRGNKEPGNLDTDEVYYQGLWKRARGVLTATVSEYVLSAEEQHWKALIDKSRSRRL